MLTAPFASYGIFFFLHEFVVLLGKACLKVGLLDVPVVHEIKVEAFSHKRLPEHRNKLLIVRLLLKLELASIVHEVLELLGLAPTQVFHRSDCFLDFDLLILLVFSFSRQPLPRQSAFDKVHEHNADLLQVISPRLFDAQVGIETRISGSAC